MCYLDLPPGLFFQDGIISGNAATRTGMLDYVVTIEETYPKERTPKSNDSKSKFIV